MDPLQDAIDFSLTNGIVKYNPQFKLTHAPFCLTPFEILPSELNFLKSLTPVYNDLMIKVGNNKGFLAEHLSASAKTDPFIKRLLTLNDTVKPSHHLQISRNDFLLTAPNRTGAMRSPKQVEFNTISNSFPFLASKTALLHQYLGQGLSNNGHLEPNHALEEVVDTMAELIAYYGVPNAKILMVIQSKEQNIFDQRGIEYRLLEKHGIETSRLTMEEIANRGSITEGHLKINGETMALAYFRAAYTPEDYLNEEAWKGRELIEQSSIVKCPSVGMQLAGAKKIQQVLSNPTILRQFVTEAEIDLLSQTFVGLFDLDESVGGAPAYELALANPEKYVLKPQREGGGNNLYDQEMVNHIQTKSRQERQAFVLMERIVTPDETSILVVDQVAEETKTVSEIGRYAACFFDGDKVGFNKDIGYLVRTKAADQNEGGVCAGYACLNSLCLK